MFLPPCLGVLLLCSHLLGQGASDAPQSAQSRAVDASFHAARGNDAPLSASMTAMPREAAPPSPVEPGSGSLAVTSGPEPGLLLLAGSLTVWFALARRRTGAARA